MQTSLDIHHALALECSVDQICFHFIYTTVTSVCNLMLQIFSGGNIANDCRPGMPKNVKSSMSNFLHYAEQWAHANKNKP